jgi:hypothetical protein
LKKNKDLTLYRKLTQKYYTRIVVKITALPSVNTIYASKMVTGLGKGVCGLEKAKGFEP